MSVSSDFFLGSFEFCVLANPLCSDFFFLSIYLDCLLLVETSILIFTCFLNGEILFPVAFLVVGETSPFGSPYPVPWMAWSWGAWGYCISSGNFWNDTSFTTRNWPHCCALQVQNSTICSFALISFSSPNPKPDTLCSFCSVQVLGELVRIVPFTTHCKGFSLMICLL